MAILRDDKGVPTGSLKYLYKPGDHFTNPEGNKVVVGQDGTAKIDAKNGDSYHAKPRTDGDKVILDYLYKSGDHFTTSDGGTETVLADGTLKRVKANGDVSHMAVLRDDQGVPTGSFKYLFKPGDHFTNPDGDKVVVGQDGTAKIDAQNGDSYHAKPRTDGDKIILDYLYKPGDHLTTSDGGTETVLADGTLKQTGATGDVSHMAILRDDQGVPTGSLKYLYKPGDHFTNSDGNRIVVEQDRAIRTTIPVS